MEIESISRRIRAWVLSCELKPSWQVFKFMVVGLLTLVSIRLSAKEKCDGKSWGGGSISL